MNKSVKHNMSNTRLYKIWKGIKVRCKCVTNNHYKWYGERGIKICDEWASDFMSFYSWSIDNGYEENLTIDRIDVNGNYEPKNCRWVDKITQSNNCRTNIYFKYKGEYKSLKEWCRELNLNYSRTFYRIKNGWAFDKAISTLAIEPKIRHNKYGESYA